MEAMKRWNTQTGLLLSIIALLMASCEARVHSVVLVFPEKPQGFYRICQDGNGLRPLELDNGEIQFTFANGRELKSRDCRPLLSIKSFRATTVANGSLAVDAIDPGLSARQSPDVQRVYRLGADSQGWIYYFVGSFAEYSAIKFSDWSKNFEQQGRHE